MRKREKTQESKGEATKNALSETDGDEDEEGDEGNHGDGGQFTCGDGEAH